MSNFSFVRKSNFKPQGSDGALQKESVALGESELGLRGQVEHPDINGGVQELGRRIAQIYRRVAVRDDGSRTLTDAERREIRDRIIEGMIGQGIKPTAALRAVASLLAGLRDELPIESAGEVKKSANFTSTTCPHCKKTSVIEVPGAVRGRLPEVRCPNCLKSWQEDLSKRASDEVSPELRELMADTRAKLESLRERITKLLDDRAAAGKFKTAPVDKDAVAESELRKALANGTPARFDGEGIKRANFQPVESAAPGVRVPVNSFPTGGVVKTGGKFQPQQS